MLTRTKTIQINLYCLCSLTNIHRELLANYLNKIVQNFPYIKKSVVNVFPKIDYISNFFLIKSTSTEFFCLSNSIVNHLSYIPTSVRKSQLVEHAVQIQSQVQKMRSMLPHALFKRKKMYIDHKNIYPKITVSIILKIGVLFKPYKNICVYVLRNESQSHDKILTK